MNTYSRWKRWGQDNPFYGVLTDDRFRGRDLKGQPLKEFNASGESEVEHLIEQLTKLNDGQLPILHKAVDYGCGVGRVSLPLGQRVKQVVGLDISPPMIKQARQRLKTAKPGSTSFAVTDTALKGMPEHYDLIYSNIVFQHIPPKEGEPILSTLLSRLNPRGFAAVHVTYANQISWSRKAVVALRLWLKPLHYALNFKRGWNPTTPLIRMYVYDLRSILSIFSNAGLNELISELTDHGGYKGIMLIGRKSSL